jgi:DNA-binding CsgD family transcriptional regulator
MELLADSVESVGYLLKDRVSDVNEFRASVRRVAEGGSAIDRAVVAQLVGRHRDDDPIADLTPREREVLELMAEGRSNHGIATKLVVTEHVVEKHIRNIFQKLHIPDDHRRVLAVLLPTLQLVSPSTSSGVPKTCPRRRRAARARGARTVFAGLSPRTRTRCIRTSSFAGRCSDVRAARSFAGTFPRRPVGWIALQAGREMLFRVRSDNRSGRFAGISSPLTDSNRRPPPYHGGFDLLVSDVGTALPIALFCISPDLSACCPLPLKNPEPPRKSPNLSPKPVPKGRSAETLMTGIVVRV